MEEVDLLKQKLADTEAELDTVLAVNEQLTLEIERLTSLTGTEKLSTLNCQLSTYSFEQEGIKYGFNYFKTKHNGQEITPVEICADAQLQKELISKKAGIIKQL